MAKSSLPLLPMHRDAMRLSPTAQAWLYGTFGILFISGVIWLLLHWWFRPHSEFGETVHPAQPWMLKIHGAAGMGALVVLGTMLSGHVRRGWKLRKNRFSGAELLALNSVMIITGYGLYYAGGEAFRAAIGIIHWIAGLLFPASLAWHIWRGRKARIPTGQIK